MSATENGDAVSEPGSGAEAQRPSNTDTDDLERLLRRIIREETGISSVVPADKWRGGSLMRSRTP